MSIKKPLANYSGKIKELQSGDIIFIGGIKYSDVPLAVPSLVAGEVFINRADSLLYYTDSLNAVQSFSLLAGAIPQINVATSLIQTQNIITQMLLNQK